MSDTQHEAGHESSPAAWVAITIMAVGIAISTVALFFNLIALVWIGAAFIPAGLIVGGILRAVGLGFDPAKLEGH